MHSRFMGTNATATGQNTDMRPVSLPDDPSPTLRIIMHGKLAEDESLRNAVQALRTAGHQIEVRVTWDAGDGARFARKACEDGIQIVVAAGGDGTLNEVVSGILADASGTSPLPSLGLLPLGTANDFAHSAGIPLDPTEALRLIVENEPQPIDIGKIEDRFFINVATGGFGTQVTLETPEELKRVLGAAAYLLTGLRKFTSMAPSRARFSGPNFAWEGNFLVLSVGNGRQAGGGHLLCPEAMVDDGMLDVTIIPEIPDGELGITLGDILLNGLAGAEFAERTRLPWLELESESELTLNLDGESLTGTKFRFQTQPLALRMHLPRECPLLGRSQPQAESLR